MHVERGEHQDGRHRGGARQRVVPVAVAVVLVRREGVVESGEAEVAREGQLRGFHNARARDGEGQ